MPQDQEHFIGENLYAEFDGQCLTLGHRWAVHLPLLLYPDELEALLEFIKAARAPKQPGTVLSSDGYHEGG